jgi:hypothetical protein
MQTAELLSEIKLRPVKERLEIIKETIQSVQQSANERIAGAVDFLLNDYKHDAELTSFTSLDFEDFYEPR